MSRTTLTFTVTTDESPEAVQAVLGRALHDLGRAGYVATVVQTVLPEGVPHV